MPGVVHLFWGLLLIYWGFSGFFWSQKNNRNWVFLFRVVVKSITDTNLVFLFFYLVVVDGFFSLFLFWLSNTLDIGTACSWFWINVILMILIRTRWWRRNNSVAISKMAAVKRIVAQTRVRNPVEAVRRHFIMFLLHFVAFKGSILTDEWAIFVESHSCKELELKCIYIIKQ